MVNLSTVLPASIDKNIKAFCDCAYINNDDNHCAHFVSHVMKYRFGFKCKDMTGKGTFGANIRVHEIFNQCIKVGDWKDKPEGDLLAFVIKCGDVNLNDKTMVNVPTKHIGIFYNNLIYHYS